MDCASGSWGGGWCRLLWSRSQRCPQGVEVVHDESVGKHTSQRKDRRNGSQHPLLTRFVAGASMPC